MKIFKSLLFGGLILFFMVSTAGMPLFGQQPSEEEQKMMEKWKAYATPGENHKYLEYFSGKWEAVTKSWMKPGTEPIINKNDVKSKMILGGRYLKSSYKGTMMGMPFEGIGITGYDNFKKKFISIFMDNTGTGIYEYSGTLDQTGKIRTETGVWDDIGTGGKSRVKMVTKIIDGNTYSFEMFMLNEGPQGDEFKSMEMICKRKQEK